MEKVDKHLQHFLSSKVQQNDNGSSLLLATEGQGKSTGSTLQCTQGCCGTEGGCGGGQGGGLPVQQEFALSVISRGVNETRVQQALLLLKLLSQDIIHILFSPLSSRWSHREERI